MLSKFRILSSISVLATGLALGCGPSDVIEDGDDPPDTQPTEGDAFLTIEGESNVFLENSEHRTLYVAYHNGAGAPLAGTINFRIEGSNVLSELFEASDVTNRDGVAQVQVMAADAGEEAFNLIATDSNGYAAAVAWTIGVTSDDTPQTALDIVGNYKVESQFNLVSGIPGTLGTVVNAFLDMTDDPNDPAAWVIDMLIQWIAPDYADSLEGIKDMAVGFLNSWLLENSPAIVTSLVNIGDDFGQIVQRFNVISRLEVTEDMEGFFKARHVITGFVWKVDGYTYEYTVGDLGINEIVAEDVSVAITPMNAVTIGDHSLPIAYGDLIMFALENIVIPLIDPFSYTLEDLFLSMVDCVAVGEWVAEEVSIGSAGTWETACTQGLGLVSGWIEDQIRSIDDAGAAINVHGECRAMDTDSDRRVDKLMSGLWEGTLSLGPVSSPLSKPDQKFNADRIGTEP